MKKSSLITQDGLELPCVILPVEKSLFPIGKEVLVYCQNRLVRGYIQDDDEFVVSVLENTVVVPFSETNLRVWVRMFPFPFSRMVIPSGEKGFPVTMTSSGELRFFPKFRGFSFCRFPGKSRFPEISGLSRSGDAVSEVLPLFAENGDSPEASESVFIGEGSSGISSFA